MLVAILISLGSLAVTAAILAMVFGPSLKREATSDALRRSGQPATAVVVSLKDTGARINQIPVMRIGLVVTPPGGAAFNATAQQIVSPANVGALQPGQKVDVHYDPKNLKFVAILGHAP